MTEIPAAFRDLLSSEFATLATVGGNGRPQLSEVWFLAEDDTVRLSLNTSRQKTKNLARNPACSLLILDLAVPYRYLELRGEAETAPDPDYAFARKLGAKYNAEFWVHDNPGEARMAVTIRPARIRAVDMRG
jgi:PPOX class probable F420-dependent enzyme